MHDKLLTAHTIRALLLGALFSFCCHAATLVIDCGSATDQYFTGGTAYTIAGASGDATLRYGSFSYDIPATGPQIVRLVFRENPNTVTVANQRVFTVKFNEEAIATNFDLYATAKYEVIERQFVRMPSAGVININFSYTKKSAVVSEIDVTPLFDLAPPPPPAPAPTATSFPAVAEWWKCQSGEVIAGPIAPGVPPGALWPGLRKIADSSADVNAPAYQRYNCDGLQYYKFKLADGTISGPVVAVVMQDEFLPDPAIWVKQ